MVFIVPNTQNSIRPHTVVWQNVITKGFFEGDIPNFEFNHAREIRNKLFATPIIFCSIQSAKYIVNSNIANHVGLFYPEKFLHYSEYSPYVTKKYLLNSDYIILPWHMLPEKMDLIIDLYGEDIFIRPNSPTKPFTGFSKLGKDDLLFEHNALSQTDRVKPGELCVIAPTKMIDDIEWRFWMVDGEISTYAPYGWDETALVTVTPKDVSGKMVDVVKQIAADLIEHDNALVIDMVMFDETPKLVEINAVSTSGWYKGLDYKKLVMDLVGLY